MVEMERGEFDASFSDDVSSLKVTRTKMIAQFSENRPHLLD